jgi:flagellin
LDDASIDTQTNAKDALSVIDDAIKDISGTRGGLGATQNRLSITVNNLATQRENISAANSRIRDVDVASETVNMTRSQILMQAGVAVLAQANQLPSMALSLIG